MRKNLFCLSIVSFFLILAPWAVYSATSNTGNNPSFIVLDMISNAYASLSPDTIDIGIDVDVDGTYDYWLSEDTTFAPDGSNSTIAPGNWKRIVINLDQYAGRKAVLRIVDKSSTGFVAINSIRLNYADGLMVRNPIVNGSFESGTLEGWNVIGGSLSPEQLISVDEGLSATPYEIRYLNTKPNGNADTADIVSDPFILTPIGSFIYGTYAGPASSRFDKDGAYDSDNKIFVYVDLGSHVDDPDGQYTEGTDIPLTGFIWQAADNGLESSIIDTTGYEGRRAQFVAVDLSDTHGIGLDCIRMNWDDVTIRNGGFEEGFEGGILPDGFDGSTPRNPEDHPAGFIPGWSVSAIDDLDGTPVGDDLATFAFFGRPADGYARSQRVWVGSGTNKVGEEDMVARGVELRSDIFVIQPIPDPAQNVFMSFNSGQNTTRIDNVFNPATGEGENQYNTIQMRVDTNGDGTFDGEDDHTYSQVNQSISWAREQFGEVDEWHYPEYRFYIDPQHQGKQAQIYVADLLTGGWAWMAVDDFYFWDGSKADLAFPNSDFEAGNLTNWEENIISTSNFISWLSTTPANYDAGKATHKIMNGIVTWPDGQFAADSAQREGGSGDDALGELFSKPFVIPSLHSSATGQVDMAFNFNEGRGEFVMDDSHSLFGHFGYYSQYNPDNFPVFSTDTPKGEAGDYSLYFDGNDVLFVNDPLEILQMNQSLNFTIEAYIKFEGVPAAGQPKSIIAAYGLAGGYAFSIKADRNLMATTYGIADIGNDISTVPVGDGWRHVAAVLDTASDELRLYVDGQLGSTIPYTGTINATDYNRLYIGLEVVRDNISSLVNPFKGYIDRLRIHNRVLKPGELDFQATDVSAWEIF